MSELQKQVILALAECNMNIRKTSGTLYMHRNVVYFHLGKVKENTGLDPQNFYDLIKLVELAREG